MAGRTCACHFTFKTFALCSRLPVVVVLLLVVVVMLVVVAAAACVVLAAFQFYCGKQLKL